MPPISAPAPSTGQNGVLTNAVRPFPDMPDPRVALLKREYVAGGGWPWYGRIARTLPWAIDDITRDFGDDMYQRMLHDPQVAACVAVFKASILEHGGRIKSAVDDEDDPSFDDAKEIADEADDMLSDLDTPLDDVLWDLLDSVCYGYRVAEQVYDIEPARIGGRPILRLKKLKVKSRRSTAFVVDAFSNVVGLLAAIPGISISTAGTIAILPGETPPNLLSPKKFTVATFRPIDSDPRGSSILRPAYDPWWRKRQIIPEYLKYLAQFAGPSLVGTLAPESNEPSPDPNDPTAQLTPQAVMLAALEAFHNGTALVLPNGAKVDPIVMQGEGEAFIRALAGCDQQITKAILTQELATEQSRNQARAAATVHQDVLTTLVRMGKRHIAAMMRRQILMNWVVVNWGEEKRRLAPFVDFGETETRDQPGLWQATAALMNAGYFTREQLPAVDLQVGLPIRMTEELLVDEIPPTPDEDAQGATSGGDGAPVAAVPPAAPPPGGGTGTAPGGRDRKPGGGQKVAPPAAGRAPAPAPARPVPAKAA